MLGVGLGLGTRQRGGPTLDLSFLNSQLDPRITFARASAGWHYNSAGVLVQAAANAPRFDYDPATKVARGLLIEEQRTNFLLNSEAAVTQTVNLAVGTFTLSMLGTGSAASAAGTAVGTGFGNATSAADNVITITTAGTVTVTPTGAVSRFQLENGGFKTSPIVTDGAQVTRAADIASINALSPWYNPYEGTIFVEEKIQAASVNGHAFALADARNIGGHSSYIYASAGSYLAQCWNESALQANVDLGATVGAPTKMAYAYASNNFAAVVNGGAVFGDNAYSHPGADKLKIGCSGPGPVQGSRHIRNLRYFPRRLSNAEIQAITA